MRKLAFVAALLILSSAAFAGSGIAPPSNGGYVQPDANWLNGLAGGQNETYQYGITAAGSTQATSTQLGAGVALFEVDTAAASTGVALPTAIQGTELSIYNNGASTLTVYPAIANNPATAAQDTINNGTSFSGGVATHVAIFCFSAKTGVWACK